MVKQHRTKGRRQTLIDDGKAFAAMSRRDALAQAWSKVWRNAGAAGGDRVTVHQFAARAHALIGVLANDLREGHYQPRPMRTVDIAKPTGGARRLTIPSVVDRVVQTAAANVLMPFFEEEFEDSSFGYRPGRSVNQAVARIQMLQNAGLTHVVDADIDNYFDTIRHDELLARLAQSMTFGPLSELISLWLAHGAPQGRGLAQGSPLSPLLANLYLDRLDEAFDKHGARIVRFADDFVILTKSRKSADGVLEDVARLLGEHGLRLNRKKTNVTDFARGFKFLGHMFVRSMALKVAPDAADTFAAEKILAKIARQDAAGEEAAAQAGRERADDEARGFSPGLRNLYVTQHGRRLTVRNQAFAVEELVGHHDPLTGAQAEWQELIAVPHQRLDRIDLRTGVEATPQALDHALATDTIVCFVDGHGTTHGTLAPALGPRAGRHLAQAATALNDDKRLELARILVAGRLRNQRALLRKLCRERDVVPGKVTKAIAALTGFIGRGTTSRVGHAASVSTAMGFEGAATAVYWPALSALCHDDFRFGGRVRRDKPGPANIGLNFLAWLLHRDVCVALLRAGLHPGFGALHAVSDHQDACIYDLMEEFRAHLVEGLFVYVSNRRILRADMFARRPDDGGWRMRRAGGDALIRAYEARAGATITWPPKTRRVTMRRMMIEQAHRLARHHETGEAYQPFILDY